MKTKIILIDDHELMLDGLYERLKQEKSFEIVGVYSDISKLIEDISNVDVDIIISDFRLKDATAFDLLNNVKVIKPKCKFIIISGYYEELLHKRSLELGVSAFLNKEINYNLLIKTINLVSVGNYIIPDFLITENNSMLTETETIILNLIAKEYTNTHIAKTMFISKRTVESHLSNIYFKLNVTTRVGAVLEASKLGLLN